MPVDLPWAALGGRGRGQGRFWYHHLQSPTSRLSQAGHESDGLPFGCLCILYTGIYHLCTIHYYESCKYSVNAILNSAYEAWSVNLHKFQRTDKICFCHGTVGMLQNIGPNGDITIPIVLMLHPLPVAVHFYPLRMQSDISLHCRLQWRQQEPSQHQGPLKTCWMFPGRAFSLLVLFLFPCGNWVRWRRNCQVAASLLSNFSVLLLQLHISPGGMIRMAFMLSPLVLFLPVCLCFSLISHFHWWQSIVDIFF